MGFVGCVDVFVLAGGVIGLLVGVIGFWYFLMTGPVFFWTLSFLAGVDLTDGAETEGLADEGFCV